MLKGIKFIKLIVVRWEEVWSSHLLILYNHGYILNKMSLKSEAGVETFNCYVGIQLKMDEVRLKKMMVTF